MKKIYYTEDGDANRELITALLYLRSNPHFKVFIEQYLERKGEAFRRQGNQVLGEERMDFYSKCAAVDEILEDIVENFFQQNLQENEQ